MADPLIKTDPRVLAARGQRALSRLNAVQSLVLVSFPCFQAIEVLVQAGTEFFGKRYAAGASCLGR